MCARACVSVRCGCACVRARVSVRCGCACARARACACAHVCERVCVRARECVVLVWVCACARARVCVRKCVCARVCVNLLPRKKEPSNQVATGNSQPFGAGIIFFNFSTPVYKM